MSLVELRAYFIRETPNCDSKIIHIELIKITGKAVPDAAAEDLGNASQDSVEVLQQRRLSFRARTSSAARGESRPVHSRPYGERKRNLRNF
jgi:hypothetical protein